MPSPDLRQYHSLTLYDKEPAELVDRAVTDRLVKFPGWDPLEANTEMTLIEALALVVAEGVFALNRVPDAVVEVLLRLFGIVRDLGAPATAAAEFTLADNVGHDVPVGTRLRLELAAGIVVDFLTDVTLTVLPGNLTGIVTITSTTNTADANGAVAGTDLELVDAVPFVESVALDTAVAAGAGPETDEEWRSRAITAFGALNSTLVNPEDFTAAALQWPTVYRATVLDDWDPTLAAGAGAAANGHVTIAVAGEAGALLSAPDKANLLASLDARAYAALVPHVIDATITAEPVTTQVKAAAGADGPTVQAGVEAAIDDYLNPDTWVDAAGTSWPHVLRRNELLAVLAGVDGVDYVNTLTVPAADVNLPGQGPGANGNYSGLPTAGLLTVTVV